MREIDITSVAFTLFGNTLTAYFKSAVVFIVVYIILWFVKYAIIKRIRSFFKKTKTHWDDVIFQAIDKFLSKPVFIIASLFTASQLLILDPFIMRVINITVLTVILIYTILSTEKLLKHGIEFTLNKVSDIDTKKDSGIANLTFNISRAFLWTIALLMLIQNLGYNISTLLGAFGIVGIAVAFSVQNILGDIFSYFTIHVDKPFKEGDFIMVGTDSGTVKHIGLKSTRLATLKGEELVVSNQELTGTRINNYKKMEKRRVIFTFGVTYDTSPTKLRKTAKLVKEIIEKEKLAEFDRAHFIEFGDFSLNFEVVYYMINKDFKKYRNTHQRIQLNLIDAFKKEGIEFAYPTQMIYIQK